MKEMTYLLGLAFGWGGGGVLIGSTFVGGGSYLSEKISKTVGKGFSFVQIYPRPGREVRVLLISHFCPVPI